MNCFIAHRGNDEHPYKENTIEAITECLKKDYISGVEFDVRMTKDKKIVVTHNMTISKVSNGFGFVKNMTLKQLRKYNFGTKKHPSKIATLDDVLKNINSNKKIIIEIKAEIDKIKVIVNKIIKIVSKYQYLNIYFCSFNRKVIEYIFKKNYPVKLGLILLLPFDLNKIDNYCDFYVMNYLHLNKVNEIKNKEIMLWTVNNKDVLNDIRRKVNKNICIITDKAYLLK